MKNIYKFLVKLLPEVVREFILLAILRDRHVLAKNRCWKNSGKGKRAWVLATGPSLKDVDLSMLKDEDCFSVSNFFLHKQLTDLKLKAHFFAGYHSPLEKGNFINWLRNADERLPKATEIFVSIADKKMIEENGIFRERNIFYLAIGSRRFGNIDCEKLVPVIQTGPQMIVNLLLYAGYKEIYLMGCDHNTLKNYGDVVENFYLPELELRKNATSGAGWLPIVVHLQTQVRVFEIYEALKLNNPHVSIYNCSPISWLRFTSIPYANFEELFSNDKKVNF